MHSMHIGNGIIIDKKSVFYNVFPPSLSVQHHIMSSSCFCYIQCKHQLIRFRQLLVYETAKALMTGQICLFHQAFYERNTLFKRCSQGTNRFRVHRSTASKKLFIESEGVSGVVLNSSTISSITSRICDSNITYLSYASLHLTLFPNLCMNKHVSSPRHSHIRYNFLYHSDISC